MRKQRLSAAAASNDRVLRKWALHHRRPVAASSQGPASLPPAALRPPSPSADGPRSLPTKRQPFAWAAAPPPPSPGEGPSFSSLAKHAASRSLASRTDDPRVVTSHSMPVVPAAPTVEAEGLPAPPPTMPAAPSPAPLAAPRPRARNARLRSATHTAPSAPFPAPGPSPPQNQPLLQPDPATLTRSDSLLNKARRVFSLPPSLKRTAPPPRPTPPFAAAAAVAATAASTAAAPTYTSPPPSSEGPSSLRMGGLAYRRGPRRSPTAAPRSNSASLSGPASPTRPMDPPSTSSARSGRNARRAARVKDLDAARFAGEQPPSSPAPVLEHESRAEIINRVHQLEDQLEASRVREARLRKRLAHVEEQRAAERAAMPALETIIRSALEHFEAKEAALKHTIAKLDRDYAVMVNEKNEAVRLLTAFVGRGGRSPPASFSSVSEAGIESAWHKDSRRTLSVDTFRRASHSQRATFNGGDGEPASERGIGE